MAAYTLRSNLNWVDLPDCAHFMENGKCSALRVDSCEGARCAFYRSREKEAAAQLAVYRRLAACDAATQQRIASCYYGGQRPWLHTILPTNKRKEQNMFHAGDLIIYGGEGVCRVTAVGPAPIAAADPARLYYTLAPVYHKGTVYAPTDGAVPMRPALNREDALALIRAIPTMQPAQAERPDSRLAAAEYNALLKTYETENLLRLIRMIYCKNEKAIAAGKQYSELDKRFLRRACELLHEELAAALGAKPSEIEGLIRKAAEPEDCQSTS